MSLPKLLRAGMWQMPLKMGMGAMSRFAKAMAVTQPFHKQVQGPHWYLMNLGARTGRQGQGLGSQLVEMGTSRADQAGLPCCLETATEANIAFYRKRGFEIIGQRECLGHTLTALVRQPR
jgi:ribosomal protein S18 acetylase RimI-like enzyme